MLNSDLLLHMLRAVPSGQRCAVVRAAQLRQNHALKGHCEGSGKAMKTLLSSRLSTSTHMESLFVSTVITQNATWFDLSPGNIESRLQSKQECAKLIHMIFAVAKVIP